MKTIYWFIAVFLAAAGILLLMAFGRPPSVSEATANFCSDVSDYAQALLNLRAIDEASTIEELQAAGQTVNENLAAVQASAAELTDARIAALETSRQELQDTIASIPSDTSPAGASAQLRLATLNALADAVKVMTTTCEVSVNRGATTRSQR